MMVCACDDRTFAMAEVQGVFPLALVWSGFKNVYMTETVGLYRNQSPIDGHTTFPVSTPDLHQSNSLHFPLPDQ
jgi:hypothetical protein